MNDTTASAPSALSARYPIDETLVFGLDIGIASVGSAVVRMARKNAIEFVGSRCFAAPYRLARALRLA